jgi:anti-anti-sigma factor
MSNTPATVGVAVIETVVSSGCRVMCRPVGDLDWVGAIHLRAAIAGILQPEVDLVIDLSMVDQLDSDGIVTLRNSMELVQLVGGDMRLCGMPPQVTDALESAGFDVGDADGCSRSTRRQRASLSFSSPRRRRRVLGAVV